jgi:hypothetical protein
MAHHLGPLRSPITYAAGHARVRIPAERSLADVQGAWQDGGNRCRLDYVFLQL